MRSAVIHDAGVRIRDRSLTVMGPLTSSKWFLNYSGGLWGGRHFDTRIEPKHFHFTSSVHLIEASGRRVQFLCQSAGFQVVKEISAFYTLAWCCLG